MNTQNYSDGSENILVDFFRNTPNYTNTDIHNFLAQHNHSWAVTYHLSPQRHFLLSWYEFKKNCSILEIGAGCGAVTGLFLPYANKVVANELEESRASVIRARFPNSKNLTVNSQSIRDFSTTEQFDYVVVIGVLEYAGVFFNSEQNLNNSPHQEFLLKARSLLKRNGKLLLAIENRLGVKYFAGHPEDHTGILYDSLNNYASQSKIQTFSKSELSNLLLSTGFKHLDYFYPFPDYKLPYFIFSEAGMTEKLALSTSEFSTSPSRGVQYQAMISESALAFSIYQEGLLSHFANSFLIEATV